MLKEVKLFRGIVLSAPGTILGREKIKSLWGEQQQQEKRSHLFFGKISRACFCLIPSVRDCRSGTTVCLSSSSFLFPFSPLNFPPMTHFRFQVTCYADKYLTSLWAIVWEEGVGAWWTRFVVTRKIFETKKKSLVLWKCDSFSSWKKRHMYYIYNHAWCTKFLPSCFFPPSRFRFWVSAMRSIPATLCWIAARAANPPLCKFGGGGTTSRRRTNFEVSDDVGAPSWSHWWLTKTTNLFK
jgi:hypothetical protein